jgi:hypothetical protein
MGSRADEIVHDLKRILTDAALCQEIDARAALLSARFDDVEIQENLLRAFLLPASDAALAQHASSLTSVISPDVLALKRQAIAATSNRAVLREISEIADPLDPRGMLAELVLMEALNLVARRLVPSDDVRHCATMCVSLADNFGLWRLRYLLEDAVFEYLQPEQFKMMHSLLDRQTKKHVKLFLDIQFILRHYLDAAGLKDAHVLCRKKNIYGVYMKCVMGKKNINLVSDVLGLRVITASTEDCYRTIEVIHRLWPPFPGSLKDYIASPKPNGYQSIHTTVSCLEESVVEFQVRSVDMDRVANFGPASHAMYKRCSRTQDFSALP